MDLYLDKLFSLDGRKAVITGGSSGIGRAIATALVRAGAEVILVARRSAPLREAADAMRTLNGTVAWLSGDISERSGIHELADQLLVQHGVPDVLINSAGVNIRPPMGELTDEIWDQTMRTNIDAPFVLGQRFGPQMAANGWGRIINIASQQAVKAFGHSGAYGVSKAALTALTRSQAEAWSAQGVCANAIAPGFVDTPLNAALFADPVRSEAMARRTMIGRNGTVDDFSGVAVFLASDAAAYITGQTIFVDGGFSST